MKRVRFALTSCVVIILLAALLAIVPIAQIATNPARDSANRPAFTAETFTVETFANIPETWYRVDVNRFHDADGIPDGNLHLGFGVVLEHQSFRCDDYDACEVDRTRERANPKIHVTDQEIARGKEAAQAFEKIVKSGTLYVRPNSKRARDKYGRILGSFGVVEKGDIRMMRMKDIAELQGWNRPEPVTMETIDDAP